MTISAISPYNINDPYLLAALQSPNMNQYLQAQVQVQPQQTIQTNPSQNTTINNDNVAFKGAAETIESNKKSGAAGWVFATILAAGSIIAGIKCHGKGVGEKWYAKTWDGAKKYWNQGIDKVVNTKFDSNEGLRSYWNSALEHIRNWKFKP